MKLKSLLHEATLPSTFEKYSQMLNQSIEQNNLRLFTELIHSAFRSGKYEWVGMWYESKDEDKNLSKRVFKALNF